jgi:apolipoprotein N-acyltransferase
MHHPDPWTEESAVGFVLAVVTFGLIPNSIPALFLVFLMIWKKVTSVRDFLQRKAVLCSFLAALVSVVVIHWWTFVDQVEAGLLIHALAVVFFGVIAVLFGFICGSWMEKRS